MIDNEIQNSKMLTEYELKYAFNGNGELITISEAESGMSEDYLCPKCGSILIAKKGNIRTHHFAHYNFEHCTGGQETALHIMAKDIILQHKYLRFPSDDKKPNIIKFDDIKLEQYYYEMIFDALGIVENEYIAIEIQVTHAIDQAKEDKVYKHSISMIEIDLSKYLGTDLSREELTRIVLKTAPRHWINNIHNQQQKKNAITKKVIMTGFKLTHGYSSKYSSNFETNKIFILQEIKRKKSPNYAVSNCAGYSVNELDVSDDESLINKLSEWEYPKQVTLTIDNILKKGNFSTLVTDID